MDIRSGRTRIAFTASLVLHGVLAVVVISYVLVQKEILPNPFAAEFVAPPSPPKPSVRKPVIKQVPKPVVATATRIVAPQVATTRVARAAAVKTSNGVGPTALQFAPRAVRIAAAVGSATPRMVSRDVDIPQVLTAANLPVSDGPDALACSAPVAGGGMGDGPAIVRGLMGGVGALGRAQGLKMAGISLVEHVGTELDGMGDMAQVITLGTPDVLPLPKGEPGGRVVGRGKDIRGVFRLVRVRHNLSDWWADSTSLLALAKWVNTNTRIKTDMSVEGGALTLGDSNIHKSPLLWMTGHDPNLMQRYTE